MLISKEKLTNFESNSIRFHKGLYAETGKLGVFKFVGVQDRDLNYIPCISALIMIHYKDRNNAQTAERLLNYLRIFGQKSTVQLIGDERKGTV